MIPAIRKLLEDRVRVLESEIVPGMHSDAETIELCNELDEIRAVLAVDLGASGAYPDGQISPDDQGELKIGIARDERGNVFIEFGKAVAWLALPARKAVDLGLALLAHAGAQVAIEIGDEMADRFLELGPINPSREDAKRALQYAINGRSPAPNANA